MDKVKQRHNKEASVWKKTYRENTGSLNIDVKVARAVIVKMFVEENLILACF